MTGTNHLARATVWASVASGRKRPTRFLESSIAAVIAISEPGTSAVKTPAAPIRPTTTGENSCAASLNSARFVSAPFSPGTCSTAAKPTKNTNSSMSW